MKAVYVGSPVVFHCETTGRCMPALVTHIHGKGEDEEYPPICCVAFCPETGQGHIKKDIGYVANAFSADFTADSYHFVGDTSES